MKFIFPIALMVMSSTAFAEDCQMIHLVTERDAGQLICQDKQGFLSDAGLVQLRGKDAATQKWIQSADTHTIFTEVTDPKQILRIGAVTLQAKTGEVVQAMIKSEDAPVVPVFLGKGIMGVAGALITAARNRAASAASGAAKAVSSGASRLASKLTRPAAVPSAAGAGAGAAAKKPPQAWGAWDQNGNNTVKAIPSTAQARDQMARSAGLPPIKD